MRSVRWGFRCHPKGKELGFIGKVGCWVPSFLLRSDVWHCEGAMGEGFWFGLDVGVMWCRVGGWIVSDD